MHLQEQRVTIQPPATPGGPVIVTQTPVTSGVPQTTAETVQNPRVNLDEDIVVPVVGMLSVFVLFPLSIGLARLIWKRAGAPPRAAVADHAAQQRLEQIQQSIDAIAIEVERISEGQRFVSKMLSDRSSHGIGAGAADPLRASLKAAIPSERG